MSNEDPTIPPANRQPSPSVLKRIDHRCDEFESAWKNARDTGINFPNLTDYLNRHAQPGKALQLSMIAIDWEYRIQVGQQPRFADYQDLTPTETELQNFLQTSLNIPAKSDLPTKGVTSDATADDSPTLMPGSQPGSSPGPSVTSAGHKKFGDYEIIEEIARGGMGVVFKARDRKLNRLCALKMILSGQLAAGEELQRFYTEAEAAANLQHAGIVPVFEVGEIDSQHYYSMGYIDGDSLSEKTKDGPLHPMEAATLTRQVAEAIAYAHSAGVIHRDLKPANVLIDTDGSPKVTDFGLAKNSAGDSNLTATGQILGTPSYMPPEQAAGDLEAVDAQSDLYSIGAILYCLVTGRPPFQSANQMDILMAVLEEDPVPPSKLNSAVPKDLETICLKCLAKDKSKRYETVDDLVAELRRFENGEPILARPVGTIEKSIRWCRRKPAAAAAIALASLFALSLIVAGPWIAVQQSRIAKQKSDFAAQQMQLTAEAKTAEANESLARADAEQNATKAETEAARAESAAEKAQTARAAALASKTESEKKVYARTTSLAYEQWRSNNVYRSEALLNQTDPKLRGWEWDYIKKLSNSESQTFLGLSRPARAVCMLADGVHVAAMEQPALAAGKVFVWNAQSGELVEEHENRTALAFSHDGKTFAALQPGNDNRLRIYETMTGSDVIEISGHGNKISHAAFSPNGKLIATCGGDSRVKIWDVATGEMTQEIVEKNRKKTHPMHWSEDSEWIGWKRFVGDIIIHSASTGEIVFEAHDEIFRADTSEIAIHRGAGMVASTGFESINLFDIESQKKVLSLRDHQSSVTKLQFFDDGKKLVSAGVDVTVRVWDLQQTQVVSRYRGHKIGGTYGMAALAISPDQNWIISSGLDAMTKVWPVANESLMESKSIQKLGIGLPATNAECDYLFGCRGAVEDVAISSDGVLAAAASHDQKVVLFDLKSRKMTLAFDEHHERVGTVAIHPEKTLIASGAGSLVDVNGGTILVWNPENLEVEHRFKLDGPISGLQFADDGKMLIASTGSQYVTEGVIAAWDLETEKQLYKKDIESVATIALNRSQSKIAIATIGKTYLMDVATGEFDWEIAEAGSAFSVAFSPDEKFLALGKRSWGVGLYDADTGQRIWERVEHTGVVTGVAFIADGTRIVSTCGDKTTQVWNAETGDVVLSLQLDGCEKFGVTPLPDMNGFLEYGEGPYIAIRETKISKRLPAPAKMRTLLVEDFEREEIGDDWFQNVGNWKIEDGVAVGRLENSPAIPGYVATMMTWSKSVPRNVELEYDVWAEKPVMFQSVLAEADGRSNVSVLYIGVGAPWINNGREGVGLATWTNFANDFSQATTKGFKFEPGRKYRLKLTSDGEIFQAYCDGEFVIERKIPAGLSLTKIAFAGAFGSPDQTINIDNLVIRVSDDPITNKEIAAFELEDALSTELKSKYLIVQAIENDDRLDDVTRKLALGQASHRVETLVSRHQNFFELLLAGTSDSWVYAAIAESLRDDIKAGSSTWETLTLQAQADLRTGEFESALEVADEANTERQKLFGSSTPMIQAVMAIANAELENEAAASKAFSNLVEYNRTRIWNPELAAPSNKLAPIAKQWLEQATQRLDGSITAPILDPTDDADVDAALIKRVTFEAQQKFELEYDNEDFFALHDESAIIIEGRTLQPTKYDFEKTKAQWMAVMKLWNQGTHPLEIKFTRENVEVNVDGDQATMRADYCFWIPFGHWKYEQQNELKKTDDGWKITRRRHGMIGLRISNNLLVNSPGDWKPLDEIANKKLADYQAGEQDDPEEMLGVSVALKRAGHEHELHDLLLSWQEKISETKNKHLRRAFWQSLAESAWSIGDEALMKQATEKCIADNVSLMGPSYLVYAAAKGAFPEEHLDIGKGMKIKVPEFFKKGFAGNHYLPGDLLTIYVPTRESSFSVSWGDPQIETKEEFKKMFGENVIGRFKSALNAQIHQVRETTIGGFDAMEVIMEANGDGRRLTPATSLDQGQGTIARIVVVNRKRDILIIQTTAPKQQFDFRNTEFQAILDSIEFEE